MLINEGYTEYKADKYYPGKYNLIAMKLLKTQEDSCQIWYENDMLMIQFKVNYNGKEYRSRLYDFQEGNSIRKYIEKHSKEELITHEFILFDYYMALGSISGKISNDYCLENSKYVVKVTNTENNKSHVVFESCEWEEPHRNERDAIVTYNKKLQSHGSLNNIKIELLIVKDDGTQEIHPIVLMKDDPDVTAHFQMDFGVDERHIWGRCVKSS